jgi:hypothetical protein
MGPQRAVDELLVGLRHHHRGNVNGRRRHPVVGGHAERRAVVVDDNKPSAVGVAHVHRLVREGAVAPRHNDDRVGNLGASTTACRRQRKEGDAAPPTQRTSSALENATHPDDGFARTSRASEQLVLVPNIARA